HLRGLPPQLPDGDLRGCGPVHPPGHRGGPAPRAGPAAHDTMVRGRGRDARGGPMNLVEQTVAWLVDPAHWSGPDGIPIRLLEHLGLSGAAFAIAVAIGLPIGLAVGHTGRGAVIAVNLANLGRAVPSLAT